MLLHEKMTAISPSLLMNIQQAWQIIPIGKIMQNCRLMSASLMSMIYKQIKRAGLQPILYSASFDFKFFIFQLFSGSQDLGLLLIYLFRLLQEFSVFAHTFL